MAQGVIGHVKHEQSRVQSSFMTWRFDWRILGVMVGLSLSLGVLFIVALVLGTVAIPAEDVITVLLGGEAQKASWTNIIHKIRLPRAMTAIMAGASLGTAGLLMQTFFRNPLAGPYILGISSGASLGVAVVVLITGATGVLSASLLGGLGLAGHALLLVAAGLGSALAFIIVLLVAQRVESPITLLILGLMFSYITGALVNLLIHFAIAEQIQAYIHWTLGSFGGVTWSQLPVMSVGVVLGLLLALVLGKPLNALLLGETYARSMGLGLQWARICIVLATALLAGTVTAFCGPIGFIGIAVPHLTRGVLGRSDHRLLLPGTMLMGALVALVASIIAEMPMMAISLPLNAVTALLGAPIVIGVILRQRSLRQAFG